jgi:hypothetical protein
MHICHGEDLCKPTYLFKDGKSALTMWNYITAYISENATSFTEYKET